MDTNIWGDFQTCIGVPLNKFDLFNLCVEDIHEKTKKLVFDNFVRMFLEDWVAIVTK